MNEPGARRGRGRPAVLTRERIVAAAIDVLDAEGLDALTMRRLGTQLGVSAMSLYRHLPNRDAVLAAVVDHLFAEAVIDLEADTPWPEALGRFAGAYRRMLLGHPQAVPLLATHPVDIDLGLELLAGLLDRFGAAGIPRQDALTAIQSIAVYVLGHALAQVGTPPGTDPPRLNGMAAVAFYDQWFEAGLRAMVSGFEGQLGQEH
ncbi:TetR/AcrR family transcriptional regulator [Nonomuraea sp. NEAU-A123]|uniref:TetR/AcrR family transcriptional regulator n=1 Tax=Nonomuraea sp. NEAU-A123 TaxID=2839649 RepID=UPI001BE3DECB|nr:TetR/AcrR family transcriptional regulator C-terminal domain-containing protein [Nonomuraea sp. NEAU-A123]MBT2234369.1 TetR/AcrR family transcriptional regulator C-terminal domain-containing protein [Nonomuraea sp. NEAU-A123]